jgi:FAD-dependent oxidoreductase domain-containing protein 1
MTRPHDLHMMKFDVVIIGGGIIGSAAAWFLVRSGNAGSVAVIEPDPTYLRANAPQAAGGVRQLFSVKENIQMSQMSLEFYKTFDREMTLESYQPDINFREQGYLNPCVHFLLNLYTVPGLDLTTL